MSPILSTFSKLVAAIALVALAGCVSPSPPAKYYLLQPLAEQSASQPPMPTLGVGPLEVADYLKRPQLSTSGGGFRLSRHDGHRWAEPLDKSINRVVIENLSRLNGGAQLLRFPYRRDNQPALTLRAHVLALDLNAAGNAELRVDWQWVDQKTGKKVAGELSRFEQNVGEGPEAQAKAYSELLLKWSEVLMKALPKEQ